MSPRRRTRDRQDFRENTLTRIERLRDGGDWDEWRRSVVETIHKVSEQDEDLDESYDRLETLEREAVRFKGMRIPMERLQKLWDAHVAREKAAKDWGQRARALFFEILKLVATAAFTYLLARQTHHH